MASRHQEARFALSPRVRKTVLLGEPLPLLGGNWGFDLVDAGGRMTPNRVATSPPPCAGCGQVTGPLQISLVWRESRPAAPVCPNLGVVAQFRLGLELSPHRQIQGAATTDLGRPSAIIAFSTLHPIATSISCALRLRA